jgi:hypothetical protein
MKDIYKKTKKFGFPMFHSKPIWIADSSYWGAESEGSDGVHCRFTLVSS